MGHEDIEKKRAYARVYRAAHRKERKAYAAAYCATHRKERKAHNAAHRKERKAYAAAYHKRNPMANKIARLKFHYGLSLEAFDDLLIGQGGVCAACGTSDWGGRGPTVDHDHTTGEVRGILCGRCNAAAGLLADNPVRVKLLMEYLLERTKK